MYGVERKGAEFIGNKQIDSLTRRHRSTLYINRVLWCCRARLFRIRVMGRV